MHDKVRSAIAHLRVTIETLPLSDELRSRARTMLDLDAQLMYCKKLPVWFRHAADRSAQPLKSWSLLGSACACSRVNLLNICL